MILKLFNELHGPKTKKALSVFLYIGRTNSDSELNPQSKQQSKKLRLPCFLLLLSMADGDHLQSVVFLSPRLRDDWSYEI